MDTADVRGRLPSYVKKGTSNSFWQGCDAHNASSPCWRAAWNQLLLHNTRGTVERILRGKIHREGRDSRKYLWHVGQGRPGRCIPGKDLHFGY